MSEGPSMSAPLVSVIIPVYNTEKYLRRCIESVLQQTMEDFELIIIDDGSTDTSPGIIEEYTGRDSRIVHHRQENAGQGVARNVGMRLARGKYILFVDSDDFIERVTLKVTTERAEQDSSDLVHFDWKLFSNRHAGNFHYFNADPFWHKQVLKGHECDELLRVQNYYSVTNLYSRTFLEEHSIRFEEGRIYEDNPFVVQAVNKAEVISLVHSPLYVVNPHPDSTTRTDTQTNKHMVDHLYAVERSFELLNSRNLRAKAYLAAYHLKKLGPYYETRIPKKFKKEYVRQFVEILHQNNIHIPANTSTNRITRVAYKLGIFRHQRYRLLQALLAAKSILMPKYKRIKAGLKKRKHLSDSNSPWSKQLSSALASPVLPNQITFLGLDYKYTGNSRYLFEAMVNDSRFAKHDIMFLTDDDLPDNRYRLSPRSLQANVLIARSRVVIAESWTPEHARKHEQSTWIQLWHGTPIKKMLFDSHEPRIIWNRRKHKINKYRDILKWDYLIADSEIAAEKFQTAFLYPPEKILKSGYPRVEYLHRNISNEEEKQRIKKALGVEADQTIILYAPTWRDYNYGKDAHDSNHEYLLDLSLLSKNLEENCVILFKSHSYLPSEVNTVGENIIDVSTLESQQLLLIADALITDYSSILFDALSIEIPVYIYTNDRKQFEETRGIYNEFSRLFTDTQYEREASLARAINQGFATETDFGNSLATQETSQEILNVIIQCSNRYELKNNESS